MVRVSAGRGGTRVSAGIFGWLVIALLFAVLAVGAVAWLVEHAVAVLAIATVAYVLLAWLRHTTR